mmetsp:Transcript_82012/g.129125  ORF Transcript_82012/g.129125 Transcript_82012/m.129125 type:complete len:232 (-) Transcript_82012:36-731(-)
MEVEAAIERYIDECRVRTKVIPSFDDDISLSSCSICFNDFSEEDPQASRADARAHGIVFACGHADVFHLSCLKKEALQRRPFQCPLCRTKFGFSRRCICGSELEKRVVGTRIPGYSGCRVRCDHCSSLIGNHQAFFHCPFGKIDAHPSGYDVCDSCAACNETTCASLGLFAHRASWRSSRPRRNNSQRHALSSSRTGSQSLHRRSEDATAWGNTQAVREGLLSLIRSINRS